MTATPQTGAAPAFQLAEIRQLILNDLPPLPAVTAPAQLGQMAPFWTWLSAAQGGKQPVLNHPRIALFVSGHDETAIARTVNALYRTDGDLTSLAGTANADLQIYEMKQSAGGAFSEAEATQALAYGMMSVQNGVDFLSIALPVPESAAAAITIKSAIKNGNDPLTALMQAARADICAAVGAAIAARLARIPVLLDGSAAAIVIDIIDAIKPLQALHCRPLENFFPAASGMPAGAAGAVTIPLLKSVAAIKQGT